MTIGFNPAMYDVQEGSTVNLIITRNLDSQVPVEVTLSTMNGTAIGLSMNLAFDMHTYLLSLHSPQEVKTILNLLMCRWSSILESLHRWLLSLPSLIHQLRGINTCLLYFLPPTLESISFPLWLM